MLILKQE